MAFRNPLLDAEPYEVSQVAELPAPASPDELKAFYSDMERQDLQRRLSRNKPGSRSIWSRKSLKKKSPSADDVFQTVQSAPVQRQQPAQPPQPQQQSQNLMENEQQSVFDNERFNTVGPLNLPSRSIIPDALQGSPLWHIKELHGAAPLPVHKGRYPLHNPFGPRWYKNHHLIPPVQPRPKSFFSPSFPSIPPAQFNTLDDHTRSLDRNKTPSGSPLPTPTSSQTGIADNGGKTRSRKTSQTAPDPVDLLDVTDPWGTSWHHQSPYDVGLNGNTNSVDVDNSAKSRPRLMPSAAAPAQTRHKTVSPSPLSQSAVYFQPPQVYIPPTDPLKLTKLRKPSLSLPASPNRTPSPSKPDSNGLLVGRPYSAQPSPTRKERRTSLLGRLAKKFSLLRKPTTRSGNEDDWHHVDTRHANTDNILRGQRSSPANVMAERSRSFEQVTNPARPSSLPVIPPDTGSPSHIADPPLHTEKRRTSQNSLEAPLSLGRLTIANPDEPSREEPSAIVQHALPSFGVVDDPQPKMPVPPKYDVPPPPPPRDSPPEPEASPLLPPPRLPSIYPGSPHSAPTIPSDVDLPWPPSPANLNNAESPHSPATPRTHQRSESVIPFPLSSNTSLPEIPSLLSPPPRLAAFLPLGTDSPLSTSSLLVNPPTPHQPEMSIPAAAPPDVPAAPAPAPTRPPHETRRPSQDRLGNGLVRQTETFKLVRSSSGTLQATGDKIVAAGHEWEVVESDVPKRSKTKDKPSKPQDREGGSRKEHRHREKAKAEAVDVGTSSQRRTSQTRMRSGNGRSTDSSSTPPPNTFDRSRTHSAEARHVRGHSGPEPVDHQDKPVRRREEERNLTAETRHGKGYSTTESTEYQEYRLSRRREEERTSSTEARRRRGYSATESVEHQEHRPSRRREEERTSDRAHYVEAARRSQGHSTSESTDHHEHRSSRRRDEERKHLSAEPRSNGAVSLNVDKPQPAPPPGDVPVQLERRPSTTARPISELPSAAELSAVRARDAWDIERLWKGRSLYQAEVAEIVSSPPAPAPETLRTSTGSYQTGNEPAAATNTAYGSSHTSYVVHPAYHQAPYTNIYHSMPLAPPQATYGSVPPHHPLQYQALYPAPSPSYPSPDISALSLSSPGRAPRSNPLPVPPRESSYVPAPIPPIISDPNARSSDYWPNTYTSVQTAH